jgi:hypothetical protein
MDERITMSSRCLLEPQQKKLDIFGFSKLHKVYVPTNQAASEEYLDPLSGF